MNKKTALIFAETNFEDMEFISVVDILRRGGIEVQTVSLTNNLAVKSKSNVVMKTDLLFSEDLKADIIILPGGGVIEAYLENKSLHQFILNHNDEGKLIAAICAAPSLLGHLGILNNKKATGYPEKYLRGFLKKSIIVEDKVVIDGNIITSKAPSTALLFSLKILKTLNEKSYDEVKKDIVYTN